MISNVESGSASLHFAGEKGKVHPRCSHEIGSKLRPRLTHERFELVQLFPRKRRILSFPSPNPVLERVSADLADITRRRLINCFLVEIARRRDLQSLRKRLLLNSRKGMFNFLFFLYQYPFSRGRERFVKGLWALWCLNQVSATI